jgi:hypothetical protein
MRAEIPDSHAKSAGLDGFLSGTQKYAICENLCGWIGNSLGQNNPS